MARTETLGIVGIGCIGQALGRLLAPKFEILVTARGRAAEAVEFIGSAARAVPLKALADRSDCVIIAVPDNAVPSVASQLAEHPPRVVVQTCGALGPSDLSPLPERGTACATFHPLQTVPDPQAGVESLPGSTFGVCGQGEASSWCQSLAQSLGGTTLSVSEDQLPLYHAAAVFASNFAMGLVEAATSLMESTGASRAEARSALRPLVEASVKNALTMSLGQALTGPLARGDAGTVRRHLGAMGEMFGTEQALYRQFGRYLLPLAIRRGLAPEAAAALQAVLDEEH